MPFMGGLLDNLSELVTDGRLSEKIGGCFYTETKSERTARGFLSLQSVIESKKGTSMAERGRFAM